MIFSSLRRAHDHHRLTGRRVTRTAHDGRRHPEVSPLHQDLVRDDHLHAVGVCGHGDVLSPAGNAH